MGSAGGPVLREIGIRRVTEEIEKAPEEKDEDIQALSSRFGDHITEGRLHLVRTASGPLSSDLPAVRSR